MNDASKIALYLSPVKNTVFLKALFRIFVSYEILIETEIVLEIFDVKKQSVVRRNNYIQLIISAKFN